MVGQRSREAREIVRTATRHAVGYCTDGDGNGGATLESMQDVLPANIRGLRRVEYDTLVEAGLFEGLPIELLDGQLVAKVSPAGSAHAGLTTRLLEMLFPILARDMTIRINQPFAASDDSEPEPDLAVVRRGDLTAHPDRAFLVVEVCHSSGHNDRVIKTRIYANAGIPEYWIVDVDKQVIEVYTEPRAGGYASKRIVREGVLHPLHIANARVELAALFA